MGACSTGVLVMQYSTAGFGVLRPSDNSSSSEAKPGIPSLYAYGLSSKSAREMSLARILAVKDHQRAITILERIRWKNGISCPYCNSPQASRHIYEKRPERWICNRCSRTFSVTVKTFFHRTHVPLNVWFAVIHETVNNPDLCISQLSRDLGDFRRPTVSSMVHRVRLALKDKSQRDLLMKVISHFEKGQAPALPSGGAI